MSLKYGFFVLFLLSSFGVQASSFEDRLIVSNCMLKELKVKVNVLAQSKKFSLIETNLDNEMLLTLHKNTAACGKFLNLDSYNTTTSPQKLLKQLTEKHTHSPLTALTMNHEPEVKKLYQTINPNSIWQTSQHLTSYINRSAKTQLGLAAAHWYKDHFDAMAREYNRQDVASYFVETGTRFKQPSVVTVIGKNKTGEALVLGAHIDTLSGNMPGADDDASGIAVSLEVSRVLLSSDLRFNRPIYIIAYAAEEQGLVGSSYVVQSFLDKKIPVKAVMQFDQAGFRANPKDKTIWLLTDYVDNKLMQFTADLLKQYVQVPVGYTECGYACSDHANWSAAGFSATYPSATTLDDDNPYLHSSEDMLEIINLEHMVNFTKLGLAFVAELAS